MNGSEPATPPADGRPGATLPGITQALLGAVTSITADLDLQAVLSRVVEAATELTGARYGALGVLGTDGRTLSELITQGVTPEQRRRIGEPPRGRGILGLLIDRPEPLRLDDLGEHPASYGFPEHHPAMSSFLGVPVRVRGTVFGNLYLTEKAGGTGFTETDEQLVAALATVAGFVIENARAYGLSERRRQWLEASAELADSLQPPLDGAAALRMLVRTVRSVSGAVAAAVVAPTAGSAGDPAAHPDGIATIDVDVTHQDRVQRLLRIVADAVPRHGALSASLPPELPVEVRLDGLTAVLVPLRAHLAAGGLLVTVLDPATAPPEVPGSTEERELLASFADQAALALDRVAALGDREELALVSERERIARELHDTVIQRLFATGLQLQGIAMLAARPEVIERLERAVGDLDVTISDIRSTIFDLSGRPAG